jgi:competence protein ComFC
MKINFHFAHSLENKVLMKTKETRSQVCVKNRAERLRNIRGSFCVRNAEKIKGKNILIVDDVTTTGATLAEAKKVLRKSGAKSVMCITLAH